MVLHAALLMRWPAWYMAHRTPLVAAFRVVRIFGVVLCITADLSDALQRAHWPPDSWAGPDYRLKAVLLHSGIAAAWLQPFGCPLPFRWALPLQLLHTGLHTARWLREEVADLARSKLLAHLLAAREAAGVAGLLLLYLFDPLLVAAPAGESADAPTCSPCIVLPVAVTAIVVGGLAPLYLLYAIEARQKLRFLERHLQLAPAAGDSGEPENDDDGGDRGDVLRRRRRRQLGEQRQQLGAIADGGAAGAGALGLLSISPVMLWLVAPGLRRRRHIVAWAGLVLAAATAAVHLLALFVVEVLLMPRGLAGSDDWCPVPQISVP